MKRGRGAPPIDAYALLAIPGAVGLGTIALDASLRHAAIWGTFALVCAVYLCLDSLEMDASLAKVARGALLGLVISVPFLALMPEGLRLFWSRVFGGTSSVSLYYQICFASVPVLEVFFRGIMWQQKGPQVTVVVFLATIVLVYVPHVPLVAVLVLVIGYGLMAIVLGYVRRQHGLAASIACHITASLVMIVMPGLVEAVRLMLA